MHKLEPDFILLKLTTPEEVCITLFNSQLTKHIKSLHHSVRRLNKYVTVNGVLLSGFFLYLSKLLRQKKSF